MGSASSSSAELGITFWDTANVYGFGNSEEIVGRAIRKYTRRPARPDQVRLHAKPVQPDAAGRGTRNVSLLADQGVGSIPWSPLAKGRLTGPWGEHTKRADTAPIVGATKTGHLTDAAAALDIQLTDEQARQLEKPYTPRMPTGY